MNQLSATGLHIVDGLLFERELQRQPNHPFQEGRHPREQGCRPLNSNR